MHRAVMRALVPGSYPGEAERSTPTIHWPKIGSLEGPDPELPTELKLEA